MIPCTKIFRGMKTIHSKQDAGPVFVWNITDSCNLRCRHCYRDSRTEAIPQGKLSRESELSDEKCKQLISEIKELRPPIVLLTGGEPLLRKNVFDIVKGCKEGGLKVGLSTNGTMIDRDTAIKIREIGVDYVGISIDGTRDLHDGFRGVKGAFDLSFSAIEYLKGLGVKTGVRFTLTNGNKSDLFPVLNKTFESGIKRFCLYHLVYAGRGRDTDDIPLPEKRQIMKEFFARVKELCAMDEEFEVLTADNHADGVYMMAGLTGDGAVDCIQAHQGCSAGDRVVYLDSTGEVYPCQFLREEPLGNVMQKTLSEILNNEDNPLLYQLRNKKNFVQGKCKRCVSKNLCGGCRARAKTYYGSLWAEDPACYLEESMIV